MSSSVAFELPHHDPGIVRQWEITREYCGQFRHYHFVNKLGLPRFSSDPRQTTLPSPFATMQGLRSRLRSKIHSPSDRNLSRYASDDPYLSYYDIRLTRDDVDTLHSGWLTDNTISFWEEYLEKEYLRLYPTSNIILLRPSMVMMLKLAADHGPQAVMSMRSALPDVRKATHVFLPVNDCVDPEKAEGGSHWSLAVMSVRDRISFHYDSMHGSNAVHARKVVGAMQHLIDGSLAVSHSSSADHHSRAPSSASKTPSSAGSPPPLPVRRESWRYLELPDSPQQSNGSDCGVYVAMIMQHLLLKRVLGARKHETVSMSLGEKSVNADAGRQDMLDTIERFREMGEEWQRMETAELEREQPAAAVTGVSEDQGGYGHGQGLVRHISGQDLPRTVSPRQASASATGGPPAAARMRKKPSSPPRVDSMVKTDLVPQGGPVSIHADGLRPRPSRLEGRSYIN